MRRALFLAILVSLIVGCSDSTDHFNSADNSSNAEPDMGDVPPDVDNSDVEYAQKYTTRITSLVFTVPPAADLNSIVTLNLDESLDRPITILYELTDLGSDAATMTARSGVKTDTPGEFTYDSNSPPATAPVTIEASTGIFTSEFDTFQFVASLEFDEEMATLSIPITDLTITGNLDVGQDGATAAIPTGTWEGHITKSDGEATMVQLGSGGDSITLAEVFRDETLNYDTDSGSEVSIGTGDAWLVRATYEAAPVTIASVDTR